jgi:TonB family protein
MSQRLQASGLGVLLIYTSLTAHEVTLSSTDTSYAQNHTYAACLSNCDQGTAPTSQEMQVDEFPKVVKRVDPVYPEIARKAGIEGTVYVQVTVDTTGRVADAKAVKSDDDVLNEAAVQAARQWTFSPGMKDGKKLNIVLTVPFRFKLSDKKEEKAGKEKEAYALPETVRALLTGNPPVDVRERVLPEAYLIDGIRQVNLIEALQDGSKKSLFGSEHSRSVATIRANINDEMTSAFVVAMTEGKNKSMPWWHTVVWTKTKGGQWKILHWHASR